MLTQSLTLHLCSYISELVDHVRRLEAQHSPSSPAISVDTPRSASLNALARNDLNTPGTVPQYEHHFAYAADSYRYLGSESCLLKSPRLQSTYVRSPFDEDDDFLLEWKSSPQKLHELVEEYLECMYVSASRIIHPRYLLTSNTQAASISCCRYDAALS